MPDAERVPGPARWRRTRLAAGVAARGVRLVAAGARWLTRDTRDTILIGVEPSSWVAIQSLSRRSL